MTESYGSHADYLSWVEDDAQKRATRIEKAIRSAFSSHLQERTTQVVVFENVTAKELASEIRSHPEVLKPLLVVCNVAGRALERDVGVRNVDTYSPKLDQGQSAAIAGYLKAFLPSYIEVPTLVSMDRSAFIDKEIRKAKGRWEKGIILCLNGIQAAMKFKKRQFEVEGERFEIDAASPIDGPICVAIDVKRIEARRDIHKRCDEIVNKALKAKVAFPKCKFAAVIYYPFVSEHSNVKSRLTSDSIDCVVFASQAKESIESAVRMMMDTLKVGP